MCKTANVKISTINIKIGSTLHDNVVTNTTASDATFVSPN